MLSHANDQDAVCVIVAAKDAETTISRAVRSALREPQVAEVLVIDDASNDGTAEAARSADDGSDRLRVFSFEGNRGPAAARNYAIENSSAPLLAILDADDFFLSGRFERLLEGDDWDFVADNILFIDEAKADLSEPAAPCYEAEPRTLDTVEFIEGNIAKRGVRRGEIGFLKPVMRRSFLDTHGLRYREALRLGEDYDLYTRALLKGARYKLIHSCGYGAVVRADSLSGSHRTIDLKNLYEADVEMLATAGLSSPIAAALRRHMRDTKARYELRHFLDKKASQGLFAATIGALRAPSSLPAIAGGIATDKLDGLVRRREADSSQAGRCLLPGRLIVQE
nr:glycosyltransferase family 2 protein [Mesorhizobium sp. J18]